jgi:hypothetical protein
MDQNLENQVVKAVVPQVMDKLRPGWRERSEAQRSWWKMFEIGITFGLFFSMWIFAAPWLSAKIHAHFYPSDMAKIPTAFRASMSFWTASAILPIALPLLCLAGMIVNCAEGVFSFTRRRAERGGALYPELTIKGANRGLARLLIWTSIVAIPLYVAGSVGPWFVGLH